MMVCTIFPVVWWLQSMIYFQVGPISTQVSCDEIYVVCCMGSLAVLQVQVSSTGIVWCIGRQRCTNYICIHSMTLDTCCEISYFVLVWNHCIISFKIPRWCSDCLLQLRGYTVDQSLYVRYQTCKADSTTTCTYLHSASFVSRILQAREQECLINMHMKKQCFLQ